MKEIYKKSNSKTRNKSIQLPKTIKAISNKNSYLVALKTYNSLPKELKSLYSNKNNSNNINLIFSYLVCKLVCKYTYIVPALVQVVISTSLGLRFVIILVNK